jgi:integrase
VTPDPLLYPTATDLFIAHGVATNRLHGQTIRGYKDTLRRYQARYPGQTVSEIVTVPAVLEYLRVDNDGNPRTVGQPGWAENSVDSYLRAIKAFSRYGARHGLCEDLRDPLSEAFRVKLRNRRKAHWLAPEDITTIVSSCPDNVLGLRDKHIILIGVLTGLRRSELAAMQFDHIDLRRRTLLVPVGKGNRSRVIGLIPRAAEVLSEWREQCASDLGAVPTLHPVFPCLQSGSGLGPSQLWWSRPARRWYQQREAPTSPFWHLGDVMIENRVREAGKRADIVNLSPHDLRRSFAGMLEDAGVPVQTIAKQLGHASIETTRIYLDSNPNRQADAMASIVVNF